MVRSSGGKVENPNSWAICRTTDLQPQQAEPRRARRRVRGKALPYVYGILQAAVLGHGKPGVVAGAAVAGIGLDGSGEGKARLASEDRKSVASGKSVSGRVDLGGRRML